MNNQVAFYTPTEAEKRKFLTKTYLWMGAALLVSAAVAYYSAITGFYFRLIGRSIFGILILCFAEVGLVAYLSSAIRRISLSTARLLFLLYAALNGLTLSTIFIVYSKSAIGGCFVSSAAMFFVMSVYGMTTKSDLTSAGRYLSMALIGIIIASLLNGILYFFGAGIGILDWLISVVAVIIFTGLTAYDSQKIMRVAQYADSSESYQKVAIIGALELYLDFINIFLSLLRLFGNRR